MALTLVTGPANAEKAGFVLRAYRAALGDEPLLVVPTFADVEHYRRELARVGAVFGVRVIRFNLLISEIARRTGMRGRPLGPVARERVAATAIARARLIALAPSAATAGFPAALLRLADELEERRIEPGRWYGALRAWAAREPGRTQYTEELGALYGAYRDGLERLGRRDRTLQQVAALDALRTEPAGWGATPVLLYGFDDLTALQRDAVETLARHAQAPVTVSLTYERGRAAFAGRGETFQELLALADEHVELPPPARPAAVPALAHLERRLFEEGAAARVDPRGAVTLLRGGGERAELELVAAEVAAMLRAGVAADEIAVVLREPRRRAAMLEEVFAAAGVEIALDHPVAAEHTAVGRALVALLRCALLDGTADDLLAWLRAPGLLARPELADTLEYEVRRRGDTTAVQARARWEARHPGFVLDELDRLSAAQQRSPQQLYERLGAQAARLATAPHRGQGAVLTGAAAFEARAAGALRSVLAELAALARANPALAPEPAELERILAGHEIFSGDRARPGIVAVTGPLAIRARRVRALFACGLVEGSFPRPGRPEPFLGDAERRAINAAAGLRLRLREDALDAERYLFYAVASRPTERLLLSWADGDDEGAPLVRSLFVDDVLDLLEPRPDAEHRPLGAAGFAPERAPTARALARRRAEDSDAVLPPPIASLRDGAVLGELRARETWSATALETYASCPVKWFVDRLLRPAALEPDPEPMLRGALAHLVLEDAIGALTGTGGRLAPEHVERAAALVHAALARHRDEVRLSANPERLRAALRRLESDLLRYIEHAAVAGSQLVPAHFELHFGGERDDHGPVVLGDGALALQGRIDRVDVDPAGGPAIVYDYKGRSAPPQAKWLAEAKLQVGLYMLALPTLLGVEAGGGLYQPLGTDDARPRGALREDVDPQLRSYRPDRLAADELDALLNEVLAAALRAVDGIRAGVLEPRSERCAWRGGCAYPAICRCEEAAAR